MSFSGRRASRRGSEESTDSPSTTPRSASFTTAAASSPFQSLGRALRLRRRQSADAQETPPRRLSSLSPPVVARTKKLRSPSLPSFASRKQQEQPWNLEDQAFPEAFLALEEDANLDGSVSHHRTSTELPPQDDGYGWWLETSEHQQVESRFHEDELESQHWLEQLQQASACPWDKEATSNTGEADTTSLDAWFTDQRPLLEFLNNDDFDDDEFGDFQSAAFSWAGTIVELPPLPTESSKAGVVQVSKAADNVSEQRKISDAAGDSVERAEEGENMLSEQEDSADETNEKPVSLDEDELPETSINLPPSSKENPKPTASEHPVERSSDSELVVKPDASASVTKTKESGSLSSDQHQDSDDEKEQDELSTPPEISTNLLPTEDDSKTTPTQPSLERDSKSEMDVDQSPGGDCKHSADSPTPSTNSSITDHKVLGLDQAENDVVSSQDSVSSDAADLLPPASSDSVTDNDSLAGGTEPPPLPLSLQLPLKELDTLEARFVRRRQQRHQQEQSNDKAETEEDTLSHNATAKVVQSLEELEQELPDYFFSQPHLDDTASVLEGLPWQYTATSAKCRASAGSRLGHGKGDDHDAYEHSEWALWDNYMTQHLCRLDGALESVQSHLNTTLLQKKQQHERGGGNMLAHANSLIYDLDTNLRLAQVYYERSCEPLEFVVDAMEEQNALIHSWQKRSDLRILSQTLALVQSVLEEEDELWTRIDAFDGQRANAVEEYYALMDMTHKLQEKIAAATAVEGLTGSGGNSVDEKPATPAPLANLACLEEMRYRLCGVRKRFWKRLHDLAASVSVRACRRSQASRQKKNSNDEADWSEYEGLVHSILDLHARGLDHIEDDGDDVTVDNNRNPSMDLSTTWAETILDSLCYEADRALAVALLHPTDEDKSSFSSELRQLKHDLDVGDQAGGGDVAKLRTLTHNLVTIRFNFEESQSDRSYLPRVFHRLCMLLSDVLRQYSLLVRWHRAPFDDSVDESLGAQNQDHLSGAAKDSTLEEILSSLLSSRLKMWNRCEEVLVKCLDEYLHFAAKRTLFQKDEPAAVDATVWEDDLIGLSRVLGMTDRFLSSKSSFFEETNGSTNVDTASRVHEKLSDVFRRHLRSVHVEAMNTMGRLLAQESWIPMPLNVAVDPESVGTPEATIQNTLLVALNDAVVHRSSVLNTTSVEASVDDEAESSEGFIGFARPFEKGLNGLSAFPRIDFGDSESEVYRFLSDLIQEGGGSEARISSECVVNGLIIWVARLLHVMVKLPLIVEDVSTVFANLCDLYITTVLRLCVGNAKSEQVLLGMEEPSPLLLAEDRYLSPQKSTARQSHSSPLFGFNRKGSFSDARSPPRRTSLPLPSFLEAEICAPLPKDDDSMDILSCFIERAQHSLRDIVNLDRVDNWLPDHRGTNEALEEHASSVARTLEKRAAALLSCNVVAALFGVACSVAEQTPVAPLSCRSKFIDDLVPLKAYVRALLEVTTLLVPVACRLCCVRAVQGVDIVKEIVHVGQGWEESKLNEHPNDYVDELCERTSLLWGFLAASAKLPSGVLTPLWEGLVNGVYLSLLEGFARIPFCSTEGRALMTLDLASFASGVSPSAVRERLEGYSLACTPPTLKSDVGMKYVDTYIKVFYYPKLDTMRWIEDNYMNYRLNHCLALVSAAGGIPEQHAEGSLSDLVDRVKDLYRLETDDDEDPESIERACSRPEVSRV